MPNAICHHCKKDLNYICRTNSQKFRLVDLLQKRVKKVCGVPYNVSPGIQHNEIVKNDTCNGVLFYNHFSENPKEFKDIDLSKVIFSDCDIQLIKNKLLDNKNEKYTQTDNNKSDIIILFCFFYFLIFSYQIYLCFPNTIY